MKSYIGIARVGGLALGGALLFGAAGCSVEQTREGELPEVSASGDAGALPDYEVRQTREGRLPDVDVDVDVKAGALPDYEVAKKAEGRLPSVDVDVEGGQLPAYDIDTADIDVGSKKVTVTVPDIDVEMPQERGQ